jgi:hypothetical protein
MRSASGRTAAVAQVTTCCWMLLLLWFWELQESCSWLKV